MRCRIIQMNPWDQAYRVYLYNEGFHGQPATILHPISGVTATGQTWHQTALDQGVSPGPELATIELTNEMLLALRDALNELPLPASQGEASAAFTKHLQQSLEREQTRVDKMLDFFVGEVG